MKMTKELYSLGVSEARADAKAAEREHEFILEYEEWLALEDEEERQRELPYEEPYGA